MIFIKKKKITQSYIYLIILILCACALKIFRKTYTRDITASIILLIEEFLR